MGAIGHVFRAIAVGVALGSSSTASALCAGFSDVDAASPFCASVQWIRNRGVTQGCTTTTYCPDLPVTRLTMAAFLSRLGNLVLPPNVLWVAPTGGTHQSVRAAIAEAAAQASSTSRWLVKIAPGVYDVAEPPPAFFTTSIAVPAFVDVEGSGALTVVTSNSPVATFTCNQGASLRHLSVSNTSGGTGIVNAAGACSLSDVIVTATGEGIRVNVGAGLTMRGGGVTRSGDSAFRGIVVDGGAANLRDVEIVFGSLVNNAAFAHGIHAAGVGRVAATGIRVEVVGSLSPVAILAQGAVVEVDGSALAARTFNAANTYAVRAEDNASVAVRGSTLLGGGVNGWAASRSGIATLLIAHSQLVAGAFPPTVGSPTCFSTYDSVFAAVGC